MTNKVEKLAPLYLQGEKVRHSDYQVVAYKSATTVTRKMTMNFKEGMQNGVLWADIEAVRGSYSFSPYRLENWRHTITYWLPWLLCFPILFSSLRRHDS